jgi:hypothetical protein
LPCDSFEEQRAVAQRGGVNFHASGEQRSPSPFDQVQIGVGGDGLAGGLGELAQAATLLIAWLH